MRIYTRTGDRGATGLVGGSRTSKSALRVHAIGEVDELNAALGWLAVTCPADPPFTEIAVLQSRLFDVGAELATPPMSPHFVAVDFPSASLEASMDLMVQELPPLAAFILPGGTETAARIHLARTICRRAERAVVALHEAEPQRDELLIFLNRLSDWLFTLARFANAREGVADIPWKRS